MHRPPLKKFMSLAESCIIVFRRQRGARRRELYNCYSAQVDLGYMMKLLLEGENSTLTSNESVWWFIFLATHVVFLDSMMLVVVYVNVCGTSSGMTL